MNKYRVTLRVQRCPWFWPVSSCQTPTQSCEERDRGESLNQTLFQESVSLSVFTKRSCSWTLDTLTSHHIWLTLRKEQHVKENVSGQVQGASLIVCVCERKWERAGVSEWTFFFSKFLSLVDVCTDWCCSCGGGLFLDLSVFLVVGEEFCNVNSTVLNVWQLVAQLSDL